jgi:hypothetical protein
VKKVIRIAGLLRSLKQAKTPALIQLRNGNKRVPVPNVSSRTVDCRTSI